MRRPNADARRTSRPASHATATTSEATTRRRASWARASCFSGVTMEVGELSARIQKLMPPERPGSLPAQTYIDIVAFILQKNAFPAGDAELSTDPAALQILITPRRPER